MANDSYISTHKADLVKFVKAMKKAEQFVKTNKDDAITLASKHDNVPVDVLTKIWSRYNLSIYLNDDVYSIIKIDLEWANTQREKPVDNIPLAESLVDVSVLKDVKN